MLLRGCKMPVALREEKFLGVASVNSLMYGEAMSMITEWHDYEIS